MFTYVKYEENDDKTIYEYSVCSDKFVCMHKKIMEGTMQSFHTKL